MNTAHETYDLVVGLGKSGQAMARFLNHLGRQVIATDLNPDLSSVESVLNEAGIRTQVGFHDQKVFDGAETIYVSPGIPPRISYIENARKNGVRVTGELDLFSAHNTTPVVAVTGTNGKTTVTTLISEMLTASGQSVFTGGNIGTPMVEALMSDTRFDCMVLEISSFQLDISLQFRPKTAVLLNISPDHMDRYPAYSDYADSKWSIFRNQGAAHTAIYHCHIPGADTAMSHAVAQTLCFPVPAGAADTPGAWFDADRLYLRTADRQIAFDLGRSRLCGDHNRENLAAAALASLTTGGSSDGIQQAIDQFVPIAHRIEFVATISGSDYYNDSKATNPDAVLRAVQCFEKDVILIMGGREKDTDFSPLVGIVEQSVKTIIAIGEARSHIRDTFSRVCTVIETEDMAQAVKTARSQARPGDTILLAPACASFDMYENYQDRGDDFKNKVKEILEQQ